MRLLWLAALAFSVLVPDLHAQLHIGGTNGFNSAGNISIHVVLPNQRNAGPYLMVRLLMEDSAGMVAGTSYTNDAGEVEFSGIAVGTYHVEVSGDGIETTSSPTFDVDNRKMSQMQFVVVHRTEDSGPAPVSVHSAMVSATDLKAPPKALKELEKANEAMAEQNWKKAKEHIDKALALDPDYATAYNNLGVLYAKTNDLPNEEQALKKAISLDDHFIPALLNLAKLDIRQKDFPDAESLLLREVAVDPNNPESLLLLADAQYMNRHFQAAIFNADKAHSASPDHASFVHYIAARAYQQENEQQLALGEFEQFLKEEPKGPRADHVRADIARIESAQRAAAAHSQASAQ
jgi:regulator of sirC expression with transglutaminase-like and TPR domain